MVKNWLITGGCGFIGCNLVKSLRQTEVGSIRIFDNLSVGTKADLRRVCTFSEKPRGALFAAAPPDRKVELIIGDIRDLDLAKAACRDIDVVVHLAANTGVAPSVEDPLMDCHVNVAGTLNFLEASRLTGVKRFIFASSGAPAGNIEPPIHENIVPHPASPYGASKLAGEAYCSAYYFTFGLETVGLRFGNVFGPLSNKKESVVAKFIKNILNDKPLKIYGHGNQSRDFIFVEDLVGAIQKAAEINGIGGELFQIATNNETTVAQIVELLQELLPQYDRKVPEILYAPPRAGDVQRNYSDISKAKTVLGWQNQFSLYDALKKTVEWFIADK